MHLHDEGHGPIGPGGPGWQREPARHFKSVGGLVPDRSWEAEVQVTHPALVDAAQRAFVHPVAANDRHLAGIERRGGDECNDVGGSGDGECEACPLPVNYASPATIAPAERSRGPTMQRRLQSPLHIHRPP